MVGDRDRVFHLDQAIGQLVPLELTGGCIGLDGLELDALLLFDVGLGGGEVVDVDVVGADGHALKVVELERNEDILAVDQVRSLDVLDDIANGGARFVNGVEVDLRLIVLFLYLKSDSACDGGSDQIVIDGIHVVVRLAGLLYRDAQSAAAVNATGRTVAIRHIILFVIAIRVGAYDMPPVGSHAEVVGRGGDGRVEVHAVGRHRLCLRSRH